MVKAIFYNILNISTNELIPTMKLHQFCWKPSNKRSNDNGNRNMWDISFKYIVIKHFKVLIKQQSKEIKRN